MQKGFETSDPAAEVISYCSCLCSHFFFSFFYFFLLFLLYFIYLFLLFTSNYFLSIIFFILFRPFSPSFSSFSFSFVLSLVSYPLHVVHSTPPFPPYIRSHFSPPHLPLPSLLHTHTTHTPHTHTTHTPHTPHTDTPHTHHTPHTQGVVSTEIVTLRLALDYPVVPGSILEIVEAYLNMTSHLSSSSRSYNTVNLENVRTYFRNLTFDV